MNVAVNFGLFTIIFISLIRTIAYAIYCFKNDSRTGGVSVVVLALGTLLTGVLVAVRGVI